MGVQRRPYPSMARESMGPHLPHKGHTQRHPLPDRSGKEASCPHTTMCAFFIEIGMRQLHGRFPEGPTWVTPKSMGCIQCYAHAGVKLP